MFSGLAPDSREVGRLSLLTPGAWALCDDGSAAYAFSISRLADYLVVLHGLKVNGFSTKQGRGDGLSIKVERRDIETYVHRFTAAVGSLDESYKALIRENNHELRGINSSLYNSSYELQGNIREGDTYNLALARNVVAFSELLRGRLDFMEFISNPSAVSVGLGDIYVYRKFDKLQKCFKATAQKSHVSISISGSGSRAVFGPPVFDLIPYLMMDNAIRYAPPNTSISVICNESPQSIRCEVRSIGPKVLPDEMEYLFDPGFRGSLARRTGSSGSGLGLSVLRRLVEGVFKGSVSFTQTSERSGPNGIPHCSTVVEVVFYL